MKVSFHSPEKSHRLNNTYRRSNMLLHLWLSKSVFIVKNKTKQLTWGGTAAWISLLVPASKTCGISITYREINLVVLLLLLMFLLVTIMKLDGSNENNLQEGGAGAVNVSVSLGLWFGFHSWVLTRTINWGRGRWISCLVTVIYKSCVPLLLTTCSNPSSCKLRVSPGYITNGTAPITHS